MGLLGFLHLIRNIVLELETATLFRLGKRLLSNAFSENDDTRKKKYKPIFYMSTMCLVSFLIAKSSLMLRFTNFFVRVSFPIIVFRQFRKGTAPDLRAVQRFLIMVTGAILFPLGVIPII